jgi:hypothetical protein
MDAEPRAFRFPTSANYGRCFLTAQGTVELRFERTPDGTIEVTFWPDMRFPDTFEVNDEGWVGPVAT